jgi:hypothetical protein
MQTSRRRNAASLSRKASYTSQVGDSAVCRRSFSDKASLSACANTLSTTNAVENLNGGTRRVIRNVKRWRDGPMVRRWVAAAILELERGFHRVPGHEGVAQLLAALRLSAERTTRVDRRREAA